MALVNRTQAIILLCLSSLSIVIHGYVFASADQSTYVPLVLKRLDPELFRRDYLSEAAEGDLSFMFPAMATVIKLTSIDIEWLYFALYFIFHWLVFTAIYSLSKTLTQSDTTSWLAVLVLSLPKFIAGTNNPTLDVSWIPRFLVLPLLIFTLQYLAQSRYLLATFVTGVMLTLHPYSAVYLGSFLLACLSLSGKFLRLLPRVILAGVISSGWFIVTVLPSYLSRSGQLVMNPDWFDIVAHRLPYNLLSRWSPAAWVSLTIPLAGIAIYVWSHRLKPDSLSRFIIIAVATAIIVTIIHVIWGEIYKLALVFQLQLPRIWLIPTYLGYITWAHVLVKFWRRSLLLKVMALGVLAVLITNLGKFRPALLEWPHRYVRDWDKLQLWVRYNTPKDALFITPATRIGFRIRSHRAIIGEIKDGSSGLYSYSFAKAWQQRINDLGRINLKTSAEVFQLKTKYAADYLVTFNDVVYPQLSPVFNNRTFVVFKL